jgi:hypothetical protein
MSIYDDKTHCVYLTTYHGNKLPPFYIGSTSITNILKNNYHGSVKSKKYKKIWNSEIKENSNLFSTKILFTYSSKKEAQEVEKRLQVKLNVVRSSMYINQSIAAPNGFFGSSQKGKDSPSFGLKRNKYTYRIIDPFGVEHIITDIRKFANDNGLHHTGLYLAAIGKYKTHKGYRVIKIGYEHLQQSSRSKNIYEITTPFGEIIITNNLNKFAKENNLDSGAMYHLILGNCRHHKGYKAKRI